jgi:4-amino-4-deoxy-L-arabinose transferase-like glycosyltransferase
MKDGSLVRLQRWRAFLPIVLILILSLVLNALGITWGLPNYVDWAQDSMALETLNAIARRFANGWFDKYPPIQYAVLAVFYTPYISYLLLSGALESPRKVFPYGLADPLSALTHFILIARIVSVLMGMGIVLLVYITVWELFDRRAALFSALIVTLCYPLVYYAHNANAEVPYLFWSLLGVYYFLRLLKNGRLKYYVLFALFGTLAICTKDQAYGLFLLSPFAILWIRSMETSRAFRQPSALASLVLDKRLLICAMVAIATFLVAHNIPLNWSGFREHVRWITGDGWEPYVNYAPTVAGRLQLFWATRAQIAQSLTLPLFGLCVAGAIYCIIKFPHYTLPLLFLAAAYYLTFINVINYLRLRFVLPISVILAFFGGKLLAEIWRHGPWTKLQRIAVCLVFAYAALYPIQLDLLLMGGESRYAAELWMRERFRPGAIVETFAPSELHLAWYYPRFPSWVKVRVGRYPPGAEWIPQEISPNKVRFPNLYFGREAPDYIVVKFFPTNSNIDQKSAFSDLFRGALGYTWVAGFETPTIVSVDGLTMNPRIDIFEKQKFPLRQ